MPIDNRTCFRTNLRDGLSCRMCGVQPSGSEHYHRGFEYHHVEPRSVGGADVVENLVLLCHDCHGRVHDGEPLRTGDAVASDRTFQCAACAAENDSTTVQMNGGWYRCGTCDQVVHLFDHFQFKRATDKF